MSGIAIRAWGGETWTGASTTDNKWTTAENWTPLGPPANDGTANIMMVGPNHTTSELDSSWSVNSLQFPAGAAAFTIIGNTLSISGGGVSNLSGFAQTLANPLQLSASQVWDATGPLLSSGGIGGSFGLTKEGSGFLVFQGAAPNTYTGMTVVNSGLLLLNKPTPNTAIVGSLTIGDGLGLDMVRLLDEEQIGHGVGTSVTIAPSGHLNLNNFSETIFDLNMTGAQVIAGTGTLTVLGAIRTNPHAASASIADRLSLGAGTRTIDVADGAAASDLVISAAISSGGLTKSGGGTLLISGAGANTYMGTTTVLDGMLVLGKSVVDGGIRGDLVIGGGAAATTSVMLAADEQISAVGNTVRVESNGVLAQNGFRETIGDLDMAGGSIGGGTLQVQGEVTGFAAAATAVISSGINLGGIARTFNIADGAPATDMEISGSIWNGGLIKTGPGVLVLSGSSANMSMGTVTVNQGTLVLRKTAADVAVVGNLIIGDGQGGAGSDVVRLSAAEQIAATVGNSVTVNGSGVLDLAGNVETLMGVTLSGGSMVTGSLGLLRVKGDVASNASGSTAVISGSMELVGQRTFRVADGAATIDLNLEASVSGGGIIKLGPGRMRLTSNSFTGGLKVMEGPLTLASNTAAGSGTLTLSGGVIEAEGARMLANPVVIDGPATVWGSGSITLSGLISSSNVLTKRGPEALTISGAQSNSAGAGLNVLSGRVNLNSNAGVAATAGAAAAANLSLRIAGNGGGANALVVLGADQELRALDVVFADSGIQGLDLNSPATPGAFRAVRVYAADLAAAEASLTAAIKAGNGEGIFDSGMAVTGARLGLAVVKDAHGDSHLLIRPTKVGDLNLDGEVSIADFIDLAANFNVMGTASWEDGDVNYDGSVTIADFIDLAANFGAAYDAAAAVNVQERDWEAVASFASAHGVAVPEPALAGAVLAGALMMARRPRSRKR